MTEKYSIRLRNNRQKKNWKTLQRDIPEAMESCQRFLVESPEDRLKSGGKLKKLKGRFEGILQYDVTDEGGIHFPTVIPAPAFAGPPLQPL